MAITNFSGDYKFLSNFFKCEIEYEGDVYPSVEHAFQAAKTFDRDERKRLLSDKNPLVAKRVGRKVKLRSDWEEVKYNIMYTLVLQKFKNDELRRLLLDTGTNKLIEENNWHDNYWGKCICTECNGDGKNNLGLILQKVRDEIVEPSG
ncbi:hypothetical protein WA026_021943 [Henosepilachna vigintioctopunctata]|uniref:NADAR domain-containing protein n=1 Tax=Henosepilachna vigintioctopunctata TaxID=420089 RepID=A0AAW1VD85_9CUCU